MIKVGQKYQVMAKEHAGCRDPAIVGKIVTIKYVGDRWMSYTPSMFDSNKVKTTTPIKRFQGKIERGEILLVVEVLKNEPNSGREVHFNVHEGRPLPLESDPKDNTSYCKSRYDSGRQKGFVFEISPRLIADVLVAHLRTQGEEIPDRSRDICVAYKEGKLYVVGRDK